MKFIRQHWDKIILGAILLLAGFLTAYGLESQGYSNEFYAASVKSMLISWKNFFFVSLDPGGWVTVDKPPVSLWIQAAFAKVFGFHGWSLLLPECLAAVASTAVLYAAVRRSFGKAAGLIAALTLALSPIFIVVSKTNNTDAILILFMVLAAWALSKAVERGSLKWLLMAAVMLGIAYNAKTLEAFLILPALILAYLFGARLKWRTRAWHLALAAVVLTAVSLSWSVAVDLTPASERPYVDNSTTNSELELAFGYNGIQRITGQNMGGNGNAGMGGGFTDGRNSFGTSADDTSTGATAGSPSAMPGANTDASNTAGENNGGRFPGSGGGPGNGSSGGFGGAAMPGGNSGFRGGNAGGGGNGMFNGGGSASPLRMFNTTLGGQDSWLLPFGLFAMLALLLNTRRMTDAQERRRRWVALLLWGVSVLTMAGYFSVANFFHPYYIAAMAPFLAALVGIGTVEMARLYREAKIAGFLLPLALIGTAAVQLTMLRSYTAYASILTLPVMLVAGVPAILLIVAKPMGAGRGKFGVVLTGIALAGLLTIPAVWTGYSVFTGSYSASIPTAGPSAGEISFSLSGRMGGSQLSAGYTVSGADSALISYLEENNTGEKWLVAVPSASEAEPIILATGKPVMAIGGFSGNDNTLTVAKLEQLVKSGQLKYFLVGGEGRGTSSDVTAWVEKYGTAVDSGQWGGTSSSGFGGRSTSGTLYDLSAYKTSSTGS